MSLESIDLVKRGDWLICVKGPRMLIRDDFGSLVTENKELLGSLFKVIGISPPIILGFVFHHKAKVPILTTLHWQEAAWSKANKIYVHNYLKHAHFPRRKRGKKKNESVLALKHSVSPPPGSTSGQPE